MPHALELPRMLRTVIPLMRRQRFAGFSGSVVREFVAVAFRHSLRRGRLARWCTRLEPGFAAVV